VRGRWHEMKLARKRLRILTFVAISLSLNSPSFANPCRDYFSSKLEEITELEKTTNDIFVIKKLIDSIEERDSCTFEDYILSSLNSSLFWGIIKTGSSYSVSFQNKNLQFGFLLYNEMNPSLRVRFAMWKK
jgi:hypothetical protein